MTYNDLYQMWLARTSPSATKSRMTRTTLKHLAIALDRDDWSKIQVMSQQRVLGLLDAAMATEDLRPTSRSKALHFSRQSYRLPAVAGRAVRICGKEAKKGLTQAKRGTSEDVSVPFLASCCQKPVFATPMAWDMNIYDCRKYGEPSILLRFHDSF